MFFASLFLEYFCVYEVFASFKGAPTIYRWGFGDEAIRLGCFWGIPRFRIIPLGPIKLLGFVFLSSTVNGLSILQRGFLLFL